MCDILFPIDVFETFRNNSLMNYELWPTQFLNTPVQGRDAMLKITKIELALIPDPDMYIVFERKVQEVEFFNITNRYSKANNRYLKSYDPEQESKHINKNILTLKHK